MHPPCPMLNFFRWVDVWGEGRVEEWGIVGPILPEHSLATVLPSFFIPGPPDLRG